ncbi:MAG: phage tail protein [Candidatus Electrothrix sp. AR4]|nr:phage tail protein [Candidatus Electrothrix sp. AR4]
MPDNNSQYPPVAFYFAVYIDGIKRNSGDNSFQEVSGLTAELETEDVEEGGENRFVHHLPKQIKHPKLVLKRGIAEKKSSLVSWCMEVLESDFNISFSTKDIRVYLLGRKGGKDALRGWSLNNALPVSWETEPFNSTKNEVAIEKIELSYNELKRTV